MIVFDLKCSTGHRFEAWFRSSNAYEEQQAVGLVECPHCGSNEVSKALMAPNVASKGNQKSEVASVAAKAGDPKLQEVVEEAQKVLAKLKNHVEANCDYVGDKFADEARKIHYGEAEERGIYGESTLQEAKELLEEGVEVMPLPGLGRKDA
ncbi:MULTISPECIES: DUF1178 family protein [Kordiimonas]|jgi:hypothetical protein|uniref:Uncharacterized protein n=1 Tax=Kordiimonas lacus TaxID=637679 RepID=A0A1G6UP88_9PROT|nr:MULTISPECIES: DUF1178 family protein [Kordiimonas]SDD43054.1 hypothetical protein SAMN04488071_0651 [Kordiimonas lacus]